MPDIADITFAIDAAGNVDLKPVSGNNPAVEDNHIYIQVTQGTRPRVILRNDGKDPVTVHVGRAPVSGPGPAPAGPDLGRLFGGDPPGFGGGQTTFTVSRGQDTVANIGSFPDQGTYVLSTGRGGTNGMIVVQPATLTIYQLSGSEPEIRGGGGHLAVTRGVELPVKFVNLTTEPMTVYTEGHAASDHPGSNADPLTFFRIVENGTVTTETPEGVRLGKRRPVIRLMAGQTKVATISATADLGDYDFSTKPPPFPAGGPCTYHVHM